MQLYLCNELVFFHHYRGIVRNDSIWDKLVFGKIQVGSIFFCYKAEVKFETKDSHRSKRGLNPGLEWDLSLGLQR